MEPLAEYNFNSKVYFKMQKNPIFGILIGSVVVFFAVIYLFREIMEGRFQFLQLLGLLLLAWIIFEIFRGSKESLNGQEGYRSIKTTIRLFEDRMQIIRWMHDFGDGKGERVRTYELSYLDINSYEYKVPQSELILLGKSKVMEYRTEFMAEKGESYRTFSSSEDIVIQLEEEKAPEIVDDFKRISGCKRKIG